MIEYIVGHVLKAITYHHLLLKISRTCGTIRGCLTIKINHENKVICTRIVMHWATIMCHKSSKYGNYYHDFEHVYCASIWDPFHHNLIYQLEMIQHIQGSTVCTEPAMAIMTVSLKCCNL